VRSLSAPFALPLVLSWVPPSISSLPLAPARGETVGGSRYFQLPYSLKRSVLSTPQPFFNFRARFGLPLLIVSSSPLTWSVLFHLCSYVFMCARPLCPGRDVGTSALPPSPSPFSALTQFPYLFLFPVEEFFSAVWALCDGNHNSWDEAMRSWGAAAFFSIPGFAPLPCHILFFPSPLLWFATAF